MVMEAANIWESHGLVPKGMPDPAQWSDDAKRQLFFRAGSIANETGKITGFNFDSIIKSLIRDDLIVLDEESAVVENLPHSDIPDLDRVRTVADVERLRANPDLLKRLKNLKPGFPDYHHVNERIAFILNNQIKGPETSAAKAQGKPDSAPEAAEIIEAKTLVANLRPSDFGGSSSANNGGKYAQLVAAQKRLLRDINGNAARGVKPVAILKYIREQIDALSSSSVK